MWVEYEIKLSLGKAKERMVCGLCPFSSSSSSSSSLSTGMTLIQSYDTLMATKDHPLTKQLIIHMLRAYVKQTDNTLDDVVVNLVDERLFNHAQSDNAGHILRIMIELTNFMNESPAKAVIQNGLASLQQSIAQQQR